MNSSSQYPGGLSGASRRGFSLRVIGIVALLCLGVFATVVVISLSFSDDSSGIGPEPVSQETIRVTYDASGNGGDVSKGTVVTYEGHESTTGYKPQTTAVSAASTPFALQYVDEDPDDGLSYYYNNKPYAQFEVNRNADPNKEPISNAEAVAAQAKLEAQEAAAMKALNLLLIDKRSFGTTVDAPALNQPDPTGYDDESGISEVVDDVSADAPVATVQDPTKPIRVIAVGDLLCNPFNTSGKLDFNNGYGTKYNCHTRQMADLIRKQKPNALLLLGDLQYENGALDKMQNTYGKYWNDLMSITYPIPGNHEYKDNNAGNTLEDAYGFFDFFRANQNPANQRAGGAKDLKGRTKGYYSFNLTNGPNQWHIVGLNTNYNCVRVPCGPGSYQGQWLAADLANNASTQCTIAMFHYPPFSSADAINPPDYRLQNMRNGQKILDQVKGKVDIALTGHTHVYERFKPINGTRLFINGLGGKTKQADPGSYVAGSEKLYRDRFAILQLDLYKGKYTWNLINEDGKVKDSGTGGCN